MSKAIFDIGATVSNTPHGVVAIGHFDSVFDTFTQDVSMIPIRTNLIAPLLVALLFSSQLSAETKTYNVKEFEYSGVRLAMSPEDAQKSIAEYHSLDIADLELNAVHGSYPGLEHIDVLPAYIDYTTRKLTIRTGADASLDRKDDGYLVLSQITVQKNRDLLRLDYEDMKAKYGPPTFEDIGSTSFTAWWCSEINAIEKVCNRAEPYLLITSLSAVLSDISIKDKWHTQSSEWPNQN